MKQQDSTTAQQIQSVSGTNNALESAERRKGRRFAVSASAELVELRTRTQLTGRASDLGSGGCYIDTVTPFPVGTSLMLNLRSENHTVRAKADVIYAHTGMGMGLAFTEMPEEQRENLSAWLAELGGEAPKARTPAKPDLRTLLDAPEQHPAGGMKPAGVVDVLQDLVALLRNRGILTETEAEVLREKMSR